MGKNRAPFGEFQDFAHRRRAQSVEGPGGLAKQSPGGTIDPDLGFSPKLGQCGRKSANREFHVMKSVVRPGGVFFRLRGYVSAGLPYISRACRWLFVQPALLTRWKHRAHAEAYALKTEPIETAMKENL
jgi:hypothetical protein